MDTLDLNIKNYELNDILNLFNLDYDYTFQELKQGTQEQGDRSCGREKVDEVCDSAGINTRS